ncbi:Amidase 1 [Linum perenne]
MANGSEDNGAFMEKFVLEPPSPSPDRPLPLQGLTFAVKDIFDMAGYVTGFGNPDWARTHSAAASTAPAVLDVLKDGAKSVGKTIMDEMAYSINGENIHYGTPVNPCAADRVPGGSSSGSAVAVGAAIVDFSLGTDTGGSVRVPASYCGIFGFRPSHDTISTSGVVPMAQSFDTVGWFARDPLILKRIGQSLLHLSDQNTVILSQVIIADDCFELSSIPRDRLTQGLISSVEKLFGANLVKHITIGDYVEEKVPSLVHFTSQEAKNQEHSNIPSLAALSAAMRLLQRYHFFRLSSYRSDIVIELILTPEPHRHEFKNNHGEWVSKVNPNLGPGLAERIWEAVQTTVENVDHCRSVKAELRDALSDLLGDSGILAIPTVPGPPPKLQTDARTLEGFRARAFSLLSIAGVSGFCQVSIPLGTHEDLPVSISLLSKHGQDGFLLDIVQNLYDTIKEQVPS